MLDRRFAIVAALTLTLGASASAQVFPADDAYQPWPCDTGVMTDGFQDESGATFERDLVGNDAAPAGLRASDAGFLYVRLRVDRDPAPGGVPRPFAWALLVDTNGDPSLYDAMLAADGGAGTVAIYRNTSGIPYDLTDPPDQPAVSSYPWASRARSVAAAGSLYGGDADYFIDMAFSWTDLAAVGIGPATPLRVWAATSSTVTTGMTGDFACRDKGAPIPSTSWPLTTADPAQEPHLAGGGGCSSGAGGLVALIAAIPMLLRTRRRERGPRGPERV